MIRLHLVRHGQAASGWGGHTDPGLDDLGRRQAELTAADLAARLEPVAVVSSPLTRARQTAEPLAASWSTAVEVVQAFGEIPSPTDDLAERAAWLSGALRSRWTELDRSVTRWRAGLVAAALEMRTDAVVFTHFVAINALVATATDVEAVTVFLPANASVTEVQVDPGAGLLRVVALGAEAPPELR